MKPYCRKNTSDDQRLFYYCFLFKQRETENAKLDSTHLEYFQFEIT